jgi:hypothetical protein
MVVVLLKNVEFKTLPSFPPEGGVFGFGLGLDKVSGMVRAPVGFWEFGAFFKIAPPGATPPTQTYVPYLAKPYGLAR